MRILASELSPSQRAQLAAEKHRGKPWVLGPHVLERAREKGLDPRFVLDALFLGQLVEYNDEERGERRTLWRDRHGYCVLLDLGSARVVTAFRNNRGDHHATLDKALYHWGGVLDSELGLC